VGARVLVVDGGSVVWRVVRYWDLPGCGYRPDYKGYYCLPWDEPDCAHDHAYDCDEDCPWQVFGPKEILEVLTP
jgi:hypothetical protein